MGIGSQLLFFLAGLGVFNGVLLVIYFLFILKPRKWVNVLFGLLMMMLCIRIGKSLFHVFMDVGRFYRQIGLSACIMIGPLLFLYIQRVVTKTKSAGRLDLIHILTPLLFIVGVGVMRPYTIYQELWNNHIVLIIYNVWIAYMIVIYWFVHPSMIRIFKKEGGVTEYWIVLIYSCILFLCMAYNLALYGYPYLAGPLLFSFVLYVIIGFLLNSRNRSVILQNEFVKYQNQKLSNNIAEDLIDRLSVLIQTDRPYLDQKLKLADIAKSMDASPHDISQVINDRLGISFNHYINEYRISAACELLKNADHLTVEGIGKEVGFNSKSAFYAAFKGVMNCTPAQYKKNLISRV